MCGRYTLAPGQGTWEFADIRIEWRGPARYNVAPSQWAPVVMHDGQQPRLTEMRWGLVPAWAKDPKVGFSNVNARSETVDTKPAFRGAFRHRRCLVPADGFFEWQGEGKLPWRFVRPDRGVFLFAGLWESWTSSAPAGMLLTTFSLLTTRPNKIVEPIHDRMPVILSGSGIGAWLDPETEPHRLKDLLIPYPDTDLERYSVSPRVGDARMEGPECIERVAPPPTQLELAGMTPGLPGSPDVSSGG